MANVIFILKFSPIIPDSLELAEKLYLYDNLHPSNLIRFQDIKIEFVTQIPRISSYQNLKNI